MDRIYDIFDDSQGLILAVIEKEHPLPPFAKTAGIEYGELGREHIQTWAWERMNRFALDTPAQVLQSYRYFQKTARHIPPDEVPFIRANIDRVARFMGIPLEVKAKTAAIEYEIALEEFAVAIPEDRLSDQMRAKYASYIHQDHLVLYPLANEEQVKTANLMFPKGLDDELEDFRFFIAQDIARKLDADEVSPVVKEYLPIAKSAAMEQLDVRQDQFVTEPPNAYRFLKGMLDEPHFNRRKFAAILEELDKRSGADKICNNSFYAGKRYWAGIHDDTPENIFINLGGRELPLQVFQKSASALREMYPHIDQVLYQPDTFRKFLANVTEDDRSYILNSVIGIHKR